MKNYYEIKHFTEHWTLHCSENVRGIELLVHTCAPRWPLWSCCTGSILQLFNLANCSNYVSNYV